MCSCQEALTDFVPNGHFDWRLIAQKEWSLTSAQNCRHVNTKRRKASETERERMREKMKKKGRKGEKKKKNGKERREQ